MSSSGYENAEVHIVNSIQPHRSTIILLHGTSQTGTTFATPFLSSTHLPDFLPHCKWVFPNGAQRFSTVLGREAHAWFDFHSFADRTLGEAGSLPGIRESALYLALLVKQEVDVLHGRGKVMLGGFSQGCAMGIMVLLSGELERLGIKMGEEFGGFVGLSGWLPFRKQLSLVAESGGYSNAVEHVRAMLGLPTFDLANGTVHAVPIWLGTGEQDQKVKPELGKEMKEVLVGFGLNATLNSYERLGHWWCEDEIWDVVKFVGEVLQTP